VNKEVWILLHRIYGGGPVIAREELDIYSQDLTDHFLQSQVKSAAPDDELQPLNMQQYPKGNGGGN